MSTCLYRPDKLAPVVEAIGQKLGFVDVGPVEVYGPCEGHLTEVVRGIFVCEGHRAQFDDDEEDFMREDEAIQ